MKFNLLVVVTLVLCVFGNGQECIDAEENQHTSYLFGDAALQPDGITGPYYRGASIAEVCGDGGYITCLTIYGDDVEDIKFECSNGYISDLNNPTAYSETKTTTCAEGGIHRVHGLESGFRGGGFEGFSSSGRHVEIGTWGDSSESDDDWDTESCDLDGYVIGLKRIYPNEYDSYTTGLYGIVLICSDIETCPQDGVYTRSTTDSDDEPSDESLDESSDDFFSNGSNSVTIGNYYLSVFVCIVLVAFKN